MTDEPAAPVETGVLICEDDPVQAKILTKRVLARGLPVLGPYASADLARMAADKGGIIAALLDVSLVGGSVVGTAIRLEEQGIPFAFITSCGPGTEPTLAGFPDALVVPKPTTADVIDEVLDLLLPKDPQAKAS